MDKQQQTAAMIKIEQLALFKKKRKCGYKKASELFDRYGVWEFIDDAFEGLHVQGPLASFEDINAYIKNTSVRQSGKKYGKN